MTHNTTLTGIEASRDTSRRVLALSNLKRFICGLVMVGAAALGTLSSQAISLVWTNTADGNWNVAANWSTAQVPSTNDDELITSLGNYMDTINSTFSVSNLTVGGAGGAILLQQNSGTGTTDNAVQGNSIGLDFTGANTLGAVPGLEAGRKGRSDSPVKKAACRIGKGRSSPRRHGGMLIEAADAGWLLK